MDDKFSVAIVGIIAVVILEAIALYKNIDGAYLSVVIGAILTIVGLVFGVKIGRASKVDAGVD